MWWVSLGREMVDSNSWLVRVGAWSGFIRVCVQRVRFGCAGFILLLASALAQK
jgi:hypothetical protein